MASADLSRDRPQPADAAAEIAFPTETEIYLLPDGRVIFADLPVELLDLARRLGALSEGMPADCARGDRGQGDSVFSRGEIAGGG